MFSRPHAGLFAEETPHCRKSRILASLIADIAFPSTHHDHLDQLPARTEEELRAHAAATGKNVEALVIKTVEARLSLSTITFCEILAPVHEDFRNSGMGERELDELIDEVRTEVWNAKQAASDRSA